MEIGSCTTSKYLEGLEVSFVCGQWLSNAAQRCAVSVCILSFALFHVLLVGGCSDNVKSPSVQEIADFQSMGPARPSIDLKRLIEAKIAVGFHRVVPGEVLQLTMHFAVRFS